MKSESVRLPGEGCGVTTIPELETAVAVLEVGRISAEEKWKKELPHNSNQ